MNLIDRSATKMAKAIRATYPDAASEKALVYALSLLINSVSAFSITLLICLFTNHFFEAIITISCFLVLRYFSGGVHLGSSLGCSLFSIVLLTVLAHTSFPYVHLGFAFDLVSAVIMLLKAPNGIENVSKINSKYYPFLKAFCFLFVCSNFFIQSSMISSIFLAQSITLTKFGYFLIDTLERRWENEA